MALLYAREGADVAIVHLPEEQVDAEQVRSEVESTAALSAAARRRRHRHRDRGGPQGSTSMIDYAAPKAALITLTKSAAVHPARRGVRANVVVPGPTWTPLNKADPHMPPDGLAHIGSEAPLERAARPEP
ncbi:SDR family oxidoreductase [Streptomyces sp. NPDC057002]|uniref:SDR family oxidoreductase n=1 Tax=Streptomyces sp. NPDC057002 TaxID=3345992 RepID=UPI003631E956